VFRGAIVTVLLVTALAASGAAAAPTQLLFDDFTYSDSTPLLAFWQHGWKVRTQQGWPGMRAATWSVAGVSFVRDPARRGNWLLRMSASTDGTPGGTTEAQVCQQRKFLAGTWATRIRFADAPASGPDGDQVVEAFYGISPLRAPLDPSYSELDWEYLPNGGWGVSAPTLWTTSWATASLEPFVADNATRATAGSRGGWHTLVMQVGNGTVVYFLDGVRLAAHGGRFYPDVPMSLNYTVWFVAGGLVATRAQRTYVQDVDWAFEAAGAIMTPRQVEARVRALRTAKVAFRDSVPAEQPPLDSPCNL
jgi:hypothetical protein